MKQLFLITSFYFLGVFSAQAEEQKIEHDVVIGTLHGQLRYATEVFAVRPGSRVSVTLNNTDEMIHNLLLVKGGNEELARIAEGALKLGAAGMKKSFIPQDEAIIASIDLVQPGMKGVIVFIAPKETGDYPYVCTFPGHYLTMRGVMKVSENPAQAVVEAKRIVAENTTPRNGILEVGDEPRVVRVHIQGVDSGRSIAVGLPGGVNYLFDAEKLMVRFAWTGGFLNVAPDRKGRGGGTCRILGDKFEVGATEFPLRIGNPDKDPKVRFGGYSRLGNPAFLYEVDGAQVSQTVTGRPGAKALTHGFRVKNPSGDVYLLLKGDGFTVSSTAGKWSAETGILKVPQKEAEEFFVSLERQ
jgi:azurin